MIKEFYMKKYSMGIFTGIAIGVSSMMFLGSSSINTGIDRYEYISGSTVDLRFLINELEKCMSVDAILLRNMM